MHKTKKNKVIMAKTTNETIIRMGSAGGRTDMRDH